MINADADIAAAQHALEEAKGEYPLNVQSIVDLQEEIESLTLGKERIENLMEELF